MTTLNDIGIKVVDSPATGAVTALLHEIADLLDVLNATGRPAAIDLRALPLAPADIDALRTRLGQGEIRALIDALGESEIYETAFPGVWWATHRSAEGAMIVERIEIALVPEMLKTHPADAEGGARRLREALTGPPSTGR